MPSEQRNMISFQIKKGASYENYQEYQTIKRNELALLPTSLELVVAETTNRDYNSNIRVITEMAKNERSKMLKKTISSNNKLQDFTPRFRKVPFSRCLVPEHNS